MGIFKVEMLKNNNNINSLEDWFKRYNLSLKWVIYYIWYLIIKKLIISTKKVIGVINFISSFSNCHGRTSFSYIIYI